MPLVPRVRTLVFAVVGIVAVVAVAGWWFLFRDDAPEEANLEAANEALGEEGSGEAAGSASQGLDGDWEVDPSVGSFSNFSSTWAGYRIQEELAQIGSTTATGRTPDVTGSMSIDGGAVKAASIEVDMTTLKSDNDLRDQALGGRGLQTDTYPTATFQLSEPIALPEGAADGDEISVLATGNLTLHGVTKPATVEIEANLRGTTIAATGTTEVRLADFEIEPPTGFRVLSISDTGTLEFQLFLTRT